MGSGYIGVDGVTTSCDGSCGNQDVANPCYKGYSGAIWGRRKLLDHDPAVPHAPTRRALLAQTDKKVYGLVNYEFAYSSAVPDESITTIDESLKGECFDSAWDVFTVTKMCARSASDYALHVFKADPHGQTSTSKVYVTDANGCMWFGNAHAELTVPQSATAVGQPATQRVYFTVEPGGVGGGGECLTATVNPKVDFDGKGAHTCAVLDDDSLRCWGSNAFGQLGAGDTADRRVATGGALAAVALGSSRSVAKIAAGALSTCAVLDDGTLKCWGANTFGQLGLGDTNHRGDAAGEMGDALPAVNLGTGVTARSISCGEYHACVVLSDDSLKCWGSNAYGQLGLGDTNDRGDAAGEMGDSLAKVNLGSGRSVKSVACGRRHTCAILDDSTVKCWGDNTFGQLGLGTGAGSTTPAVSAVNLGSGRTAKRVVTGQFHTCVVLDDDDLKCFGANRFGQLGVSDTAPRGITSGQMGDALVAVNLGGGRKVRSVASCDATAEGGDCGNSLPVGAECSHECAGAGETAAVKTTCDDDASIVRGTCAVAGAAEKAAAEATRDTMIAGITDATLKKKAKLLADAAIAGESVKKLSAKLEAADETSACSSYYLKASISPGKCACVATAASRRRRRSLAAATYDVSVFFKSSELSDSALNAAAESLKAEGVGGVEVTASVDPIAELKTIYGVNASDVETFETQAEAAVKAAADGEGAPPPPPPPPDLVLDDDDPASRATAGGAIIAGALLAFVMM